MDTRKLQHEDEQDNQPGAAPPDVTFDDPEADQAFAQAQAEERLRQPGATTIQAVMVPLDALVVSGQFQIRQELTEVFVRRYAAAYEVGAEMPPIEVGLVRGSNGKPTYYVIDGFHRIEALSRLGRTEVEAKIYEVATLNEVLWKGWKLNQHGVHYTREERITAFKLYLTMGQHLFRPRSKAQLELKSIRQIAKEWGRSPNTIWKLICRIDKRLAAKYRQRSGGRFLREKTGDGSFPARKLAQIDVARRDLKNVVNIARGEAPEQQAKITAAAEATVKALKTINSTEPWQPEAIEF